MQFTPGLGENIEEQNAECGKSGMKCSGMPSRMIFLCIESSSTDFKDYIELNLEKFGPVFEFFLRRIQPPVLFCDDPSLFVR
ncbi:hypothetical protein SUGI_0123240 [Cryptomeria japonica]|nr:hypothetical protein SUGI_0123240 [Cryptomeria japonica]